MKIPIAKLVFDKDDFEMIQMPLEAGWVVQGRFVKKFEEQFCNFTSSKFAVAVSSGTTALHSSLAALGVSEGDEVIVPAFTWVATANAVEYCSAKPVFCDIELSTFNLDVAKIESLITPATKAIIPVHLFGLPVEIDQVMIIAQKYNLKVIEDAACGFGAYYKDIHVGNFGDAGCFSFHPRKAITTGEGGMVTTSNVQLDSKCRELRDHGASRSNNFPFLLSDYDELGFNYRMTDIQAALGVSQLKKADAVQSKRIAAADRYDALLKEIIWLQKPFRSPQSVHGFQSYVCLFKPEKPTLENYKELCKKRNDLMSKLEGEGISTRQGTHAVTCLGYYKKKYQIKEEDFPNALFADRLSLALPLFADLTAEEQDYIVKNLKDLYI